MDAIDRMNAAWRRQLPALDPTSLEVVGRILVLARHLERRATAALARHGLTLGQFDILATLRRHGPHGGITPGRLLQSVMLTSGGMTARLTRLESLGLIERTADPNDRRGVVVRLTSRGRRVIDAAAATRFREADRSLPPLSPADRRRLADWLRSWLSAVEAGPTR
jgi:DNA-binding MarR family transcriptional regulator